MSESTTRSEKIRELKQSKWRWSKKGNEPAPKGKGCIIFLPAKSKLGRGHESEGGLFRGRRKQTASKYVGYTPDNVLSYKSNVY